MEKKKNPLAAIAAIAPGIINTIASIIKEKRKDPTASVQPTGTEFVHEEIGKGIQLSSKRILNVVGTGIIVTFALADMTAHGITGMNTIVLSIGVVYSATMSLITYLSDRKQ